MRHFRKVTNVDDLDVWSKINFNIGTAVTSAGGDSYVSFGFSTRGVFELVARTGSSTGRRTDRLRAMRNAAYIVRGRIVNLRPHYVTIKTWAYIDLCIRRVKRTLYIYAVINCLVSITHQNWQSVSLRYARGNFSGRHKHKWINSRPRPTVHQRTRL